MFGHVAPTLATKKNDFLIGMSLSLGANVKIKNNFWFCISPFLHFPLGGFNERDFLGYKIDNPFFLYNFRNNVWVTVWAVLDLFYNIC